MGKRSQQKHNLGRKRRSSARRADKPPMPPQLYMTPRMRARLEHLMALGNHRSLSAAAEYAVDQTIARLESQSPPPGAVLLTPPVEQSAGGASERYVAGRG